MFAQLIITHEGIKVWRWDFAYFLIHKWDNSECTALSLQAPTN